MEWGSTLLLRDTSPLAFRDDNLLRLHIPNDACGKMIHRVGKG